MIQEEGLDSQLDQVGPTRGGAQTGILRLRLAFLFINGCFWL